MSDDILQEIRATREAFALEHGYDARKMVAALRRLNDAGRPVVRLAPRPPAETANRPVERAI